MATDIHGLSVKELTFLHNRIHRGLELSECYLLYNPKTKQGKDNRTRSGWATMDQIQKKVGAWKDVYSLAGLGPDKIARVYREATEATKDGKPDHDVRLKAARDLRDIHGLTDPTLNVKIDQPLPATIIIEVEKEHGTSDDSA